ncbi:MAG: ferrous iron transport protein B [Fusobacteriaceae bacterium]|jgi:ferrous iron transport protein B|nr:ferrous iron transport protein B [Fusobacteriaceae bacterium]
MSIKIALAGNPNSGKTTLFNALTGSSQFVGNWPGVTVEKKEGKIRGLHGGEEAILVDLPGIYSLSPYTLEEVVSRNYLTDEKPDAIINIIDGSNLERNLYLTTQLAELGIPMIVAVNMIDVVRKKGDTLDSAKLSQELGCPVLEISALKGEGVRELAEKAMEVAIEGKPMRHRHKFAGSVEHAVAHIEEAALHDMPDERQRWFAIKLFERDEKIIEKLHITPETLRHIEKDIAHCEEEQDDDAESIITNERYIYIASIIGGCYTCKSKGQLTNTDKIDRIVTNRLLALPIFILVMFVIYYVSVTTVGAWATDWANDGLFGEGFDLFGSNIHVPGIPVLVGNFLEAVHCAAWLQSLILDGIIAGVGAVLGFVPQMLVLFLFLAIVEDIGYMARIAFIMDRIFRKFGLSGKSFIPILIGTGCGVPGIMASRTIENERDRRMTIMTTTFIPCGAKLPVIALISGALFDGAWWVAPSAYFIGIAAIIASGILLKKTGAFAGEPAPFVMELPPYHIPAVSNVLHSMWERGSSFIKKAGTIILLATIFVWFTSSFGFADGSFAQVDMDQSILAWIGNKIAWIFKPLGWGDWKAAVAAITGLIAKENVVGTLGILYGGLEEVSEDGAEIWDALRQAMAPAMAYSFLVFNLLCAPCFAAMGAIKREMNNGRWTMFAIAYECVFAYCIALIIYQLDLFFTGGGFTAGTMTGLILFLLLGWLIVRPPKKERKNIGRRETRDL